MSTAFDVLGEPARRRILDLLREGEQPVGDLVARTGLSQPNVSKHLRVLREAGLVAVRQQAQRRLYRLQPAPLAEIDAWLEPYRVFWSDRLDALARQLDAAGPNHPAPFPLPGGKEGRSRVLVSEGGRYDLRSQTIPFPLGEGTGLPAANQG